MKNLVIGTKTEISEPYFEGKYPNAKYCGDRKFTGEIIADKYGCEGKQLMEQSTPQLYKKHNTQLSMLEYLQIVSQMNDLYEQLKPFHADSSYTDIIQQYRNNYYCSRGEC